MTDQNTAEAKDKNAFETFLEHQRQAISEASKALISLIPADFKDHGQTAIKEMIEGYRKLFNATFDEISGVVSNFTGKSSEEGEK